MWTRHKRLGYAEVRLPTPEDTVNDMSVADDELEEFNGPRNGMVARNPLDHNNQWYICRKYWEQNFEQEGTAL